MGHKHSGVSVSGQVKFVLFHFLESGIESSQGFDCLFNKDGIGNLRGLVCDGAEPDACRKFQIQHVGVFVPGVIIELEVMGSGVEDERPIFVEGPEKT